MKVIAQPVYRLDRSYSWNYSHSPILPRVRRVPSGPGGKFLDHHLNSPIGIAAGPLLNSKWVEAYSRVGFDVLTYKTVRSMAMPAHGLPNIRPVENREHAAIAPKRTSIDRHYHDCDEYWVILEGRGTVVVDDQQMPVKPGDCFAIRMGHPHDFPDVESEVRAVFFETTLSGEKRIGHLWNHTHGVARPQPLTAKEHA